MTKQGARMAVVATTIGLVSLLAGVQVTSAAQANFPRISRGLSTWMARAMDACSAPTLSVVGQPNLPPGGCPQTNTVTDNTLGMNFLKLRVSRLGFIGMFGRGFTLGDALRVRLTLRVTKPNVTTLNPAGSNRVTFEDKTFECPKTPDAFLIRPSGVVVGRTHLDACLRGRCSVTTSTMCTQNTDCPITETCVNNFENLQTGNIEILDLSVINANTGQVVAVPGVVR